MSVKSELMRDPPIASSAFPHPRRTTVGIAEAAEIGMNPTDRWNAVAVAVMFTTIAMGSLAALALRSFANP